MALPRVLQERGAEWLVSVMQCFEMNTLYLYIWAWTWRMQV